MPNFTFKVGAVDVAPHVAVGPDDGWDPADSDFFEPEFATSPLREGGVLSFEQVGMREMVVPLRIHAASKDALHTLVRTITQELQRPGVVVEWKDAAAGLSTFFDLRAGRLDHDFNFRRQENNWITATLRLWCAPYGHTNSQTVAGTAAASGLVADALLPQASDFDAPAQLDVTITAGSAGASGGRLVGFSCLPHPSYAPFIPAASLTNAMANATLVGASGAPASQYRGFPIGVAGISEEVARPQVFAASAYVGQNRVLVAARTRSAEPVAIRAHDFSANAIGPTALATAPDWQLLDLGVWSIPSRVVLPSAMSLSLQAGHTLASGATQAMLTATHALQLGGLVLLPEDSTALITDIGGVIGAGATLSSDSFERNGFLDNSSDLFGNRWKRGLSFATNALYALTANNGHVVQNNGTIIGSVVNLGEWAYRVDITPRSDLFISADVAPLFHASLLDVGVRCEVSDKVWTAARYAVGTTTHRLQILVGSSNGATAVIANVLVPSRAANGLYGISLSLQNGQIDARLQDYFYGTTVGSCAAANAIGALPGQPGIRGRGLPSGFFAPAVYAFQAGEQPEPLCAPRDVYRLDGITGRITRRTLAGDINGRLDSEARGALPLRVSPSPARVVGICKSRAPGPANDILDLNVEQRERFFYAR